MRLSVFDGTCEFSHYLTIIADGRDITRQVQTLDTQSRDIEILSLDDRGRKYVTKDKKAIAKETVHFKNLQLIFCTQAMPPNTEDRFEAWVASYMGESNPMIRDGNIFTRHETNRDKPMPPPNKVIPGAYPIMPMPDVKPARAE